MSNPTWGGVSLGLRYMLASAFFFSMMSVLVKFAGRTMHSQQIVLARAVVALVLSYAAIRKLGISPWGDVEVRKLLIIRGVLGFVGLTCFFYAITHLPLGDSTVIQYTNPIFTALIAGIFLKERLRRIELLGAMGSIVGVALIARPSFIFGVQSLNPYAVGAALCGAVVSAFAYTTVRALSGRAHAMVVVFYFPLIATPLAIPTAWPVLSWPSPLEWLLLLGVGVLTQIAQVFMTRGLHLEKAGRAMSVTYSQIVFAFVWGMLFFNEIPSVLSIVGAVIIMTCSTIIMRQRSKEPAKHEEGDVEDERLDTD